MSNTENPNNQFELAYNEVVELVNRFQQRESYYLRAEYQEAEVRQDFIDKFFTALGWDVAHKRQHNPYEQEVKIEKNMSIQGSQRRADYSFALAPNYRDPKFLVEAKKPSVEIKNKDHYFQAIRYGWNATTPIVVLTDFQQFHILDCRYKPDINYSINQSLKEYHYTDFLNVDKFAEVYYLFSREAVANNAIEKYADTLPKPKGKAYQKSLFAGAYKAIDDDFLEYIDEIRETLAKAFKRNAPELTSEELTEATQRTIDRLVFIRFLEDKLIEQETYVDNFGDRGNAWTDFISTCRRLDAKYNGVLFKEHFIDKKDFIGPDDNEFHRLCVELSNKNTPYDFNYIPIHILGSIYERFLGKVVHATAKRVTIEEKPEVRKAGGVFYTPKYIVDYIVKNTIGQLIEGKNPEQIAKMRFADIACGSGSFLISVYEYLLDYHRQYYQANPDKAKKDGCILKDKIWVLTTKQKQNILVNNIYGVDIDQQAVEVTQVSLYLKMLEDETTATVNDMQVLFHQKILPDLTKNIVCGNSLIGSDIYQENLFSAQEERKLNVMDYKVEFADIIRQGGFDAIVGNPPYVQLNILDNYSQAYLTSRYSANTDLYSIFIQKALSLLKEKNYLGYIVPSLFIKGVNYSSLRKVINENAISFHLTEHGDGVFKHVNMPTCTIVITKGKRQKMPDFFLNKYISLFKKTKTLTLKSISITRRGLEIGKDKLIDNGYKKCMTGGNLDSYLIKNCKYISKETHDIFSKEQTFFTSPKIITRETGNKFYTTVEYNNYLNTRSIYNTKITNNKYTAEYVVGIINSKLFEFYFKQFISPNTNIFPKIRIAQLNELPIVELTSYNKVKIKEISTLVKQIIEAKKQVTVAHTDADLRIYNRRIDTLEVQINELVYQIYNLTPDEIAIVEGA